MTQISRRCTASGSLCDNLDDLKRKRPLRWRTQEFYENFDAESNRSFAGPAPTIPMAKAWKRLHLDACTRRRVTYLDSVFRAENSDC